MFTFTSSAFVPSSLRTRGPLVLLMTTLSTVCLLFSKDLRVFHHKLRDKETVSTPDDACKGCAERKYLSCRIN